MRGSQLPPVPYGRVAQLASHSIMHEIRESAWWWWWFRTPLFDNGRAREGGGLFSGICNAGCMTWGYLVRRPIGEE